MLDHTEMSDLPSDEHVEKRYQAPPYVREIALASLLKKTGRTALEPKQFNLLKSEKSNKEYQVFYAGDFSLLDRPCVSIVGSRDASPSGLARARRLARELAHSGFVVVSGLARGIDTAALSSAIDAGGSAVAVIGTPLDKAYPAENARLQEAIYSDHLLISPFAAGEKTFKSNFPKRNRVMAAVSDVTVIVEASNTSGSLHQAAECAKLGRWLFIAKSLVDNPSLDWPKKFLKGSRTAVLTSTKQIADALTAERA